MENKKKYYINLFLIGLAIITVFVTYKFGDKFPAFDRTRNVYRGFDNYLSNSIDSSLYDSYYSQYKSGALKYVLRTLKTPYEKDDNYESNESLLEGDNEWEGAVESTTEATQNNKPYVTYITNLDVDRSKDPQHIDLDKNYYVVKGYYEDGRINFTHESNSKDYDSLNASLRQEVRSTLMNSLRRNTNIKKINFLYAIDNESEEFKEHVVSSEFANNYAFNLPMAIIAGVIITALAGLFIKFQKMKESTFYQGVMRIPLAVVVALTILWFAAFAQIYYMVNGGRITVPSALPVLLISIFICYTIYLATMYCALWIKGVILEGKKSAGVQNMLVAKIFKTFNKIDFSNNGITKLIVAAIVLLVLGFIIIIGTGSRELAIIFWVVTVAVGVYLVKGHIDDVEVVREGTEEIAAGNYEDKIELKHYKEIENNLNHASENLQKAVEEAIKSERLKSELITNVSHDLKTPLTSVINYAELLNKNDLSEEEIKEYSEIVYKKSHQLKKLIEDLFEASKINTENVELNRENIDLKELLKQIVGEWSDKLESSGLEIITNYPEEECTLYLDGGKMYRVLENIFSNISKYAMDNTRVYVDLKIEDNKKVLEIKNISKYSLNISAEQLMERFTRGDVARNTEGSGLGLSIAKSLTEILGGSFTTVVDGDLFKVRIEFKED